MTALENSFKSRLNKIAKDRNLTSAEVWHNVITERFLVRLCQSLYHPHFILKGGTLLARHIDIGRETRDLDFSIRHFSNEMASLQEAFNEIVQIQIDDNFIFINPVVTPLEHPHMQYPGGKVKVEVRFGKSRFSLFIDLGFGDLIYPQEKEIRLLANANGPLFEQAIRVNCYPVEFIFAEKLETVVFRGGENSRMKDFHDLHSLVHAKILNREDTMKAIQAVFNHRKTPLQLPIQFSALQLSSLQEYWRRYYQATPSKLPSQIEGLIDVINRFYNSAI